jgi:hypothetical protein
MKGSLLRVILNSKEVVISFYFGYGDFGGEFSVMIEMEVEVVGEHEVVEGGFVAVELFLVAGFLLAIEIGVADVFGFDESYRDIFLGDDIVGGATGLAFGFVGGSDFGDEGFDELLEVAAEGVFGGVA